MTRKMSEKLHSDRGASLAVALIFFLLCAVAGSVILASASASMGRVKNADEGERERYLLYSFVRLAKERAGEHGVFGEEEDGSFTEEAFEAEYEYTTTEIEIFEPEDEDDDGEGSDESGGDDTKEPTPSDDDTGGDNDEDEEEIEEKLPEFDAALVDIADLADIQSAMAAKIIGSYWNSYVVNGWEKDEVPVDRSWHPTAVSVEEDEETLTFPLTELFTMNFTQDEETIMVWARMEMDEQFNTVLTICRYMEGDFEADLAGETAAGRAYQITIPATEAYLTYEQEYEVTDEITTEYADEEEEEILSITTVTTREIKRTVTLSDFGWGEAVISAVLPETE